MNAGEGFGNIAERLRERLGKGGRTLLKKGFSPPSPNPIPSFPKTFVFIESLSEGFPGRTRLAEKEITMETR